MSTQVELLVVQRSLLVTPCSHSSVIGIQQGGTSSTEVFKVKLWTAFEHVIEASKLSHNHPTS